MSRETTGSKEYVALLLDMWLLIISHTSVKFYSDRSPESKFKTFFICHVTLCDHVINRLCGLMDNKSALGSHGSCRSRDITFFICHMITWSCDQSIKRLNGQWPFTINLHFLKFGSHGPRGSGEKSLFISHVTSYDHVIIGSNLPSVVTISLVEVEKLSVLIFNLRRRIHMIILLQSVTIQFRRLFWHISYYKVHQNSFITKCSRLLLQSASVITKCDSFNKVRRKNFCVNCNIVRVVEQWNFKNKKRSNGVLFLV